MPSSAPGGVSKGRSAVRLRRPSGRPLRVASSRASPSKERFFANDRYRAEREWIRYEGTGQRDLFRVLRERFLARHAPAAEFAVDIGSGPGRFTGRLSGSPTSRTVALDIGREMLRELVRRWPGTEGGPALPERVLGDALSPPFEDGRFGSVAALGNLLGFVSGDSERLLERMMKLVAPGGTLFLEVAPGPGEFSRHLRRLPPRSVARLLRSPTRAVALRIAREGFGEEPRRKKAGAEFRRIDPSSLERTLTSRGFRVPEILAVAPALGPDPERCAAARGDPKAWAHLLEVEEEFGRGRDRWNAAAAVLMAAVAPG